jgi:hypothetical protein
MLRPIVKTVVHKGFDLPTISWEGEPAYVLRAKEISLRIALARSDQHSRSANASGRARQAIERSVAACSDMHTLYAECDLTPAEAEQAIFAARLSAEIAEDTTDTSIRDGSFLAWLNDDGPVARRKKFKLIRPASLDAREKETE